MADTETLEDTYPDTPAGNAKRLAVEFEAAKKELAKFHERGKNILKRYRDERDNKTNGDTRLNLFTSNIQTLGALLYGKTPAVDVSRRFADSSDDVARVAAEMLERLLNTDIERDGDCYATALQQALSDRLLVGLGNCRIRYEMEEEEVPGTPAILRPHPLTGQMVEMAPEVPPTTRKAHEDVEVDYVHWRDQLWSPARTFDEVRWWAFRCQMTRAALSKRFGKDIAKTVPLNSKKSTRNGTGGDSAKADPRDRADVWEVWDKEHGKVFWWVEGVATVLDTKEDPLELEGFWPFPRPLLANITTDSIVPNADFVLGQDLYDEVDLVSTRINLLQRAIKVAGVYDQTADGVKRLLDEGTGNILIPVPNWNMFAEKGGVRGAIDWMPLEQVVGALDKLREYRTELIGLLFQVTGMSDIMRGQATGPTTATEQSIKARFASVRVQALQDEFARFASDIQKLKAEVIAKQFDVETILQRSNARFLAGKDADVAPQAAELIKSDFSCYRIQVKPENINLADAAALKQERVEAIGALGQFFQAMAPVVQSTPQAMPMALQLAQWMLAGIKGASTMESIFDQAVTQAQQQAQQAAQQPPSPPPPDPKLQAEQLKAQNQHSHTQHELQADLTRIHAQAQSNVMEHQAQAVTNVREAEALERAKALNAVNAVTSRGLVPQ